MKQTITLLLRLALGGVLLYAGFSKLGQGAEFAEAIANFRILPAAANQILAVLLPWWELSAGLFLVVGLWPQASALISTLLFAAFGVAVTSALIRGLDIHCGCFGTASAHRLGLQTLAIDLAGLGVSIALLVYFKTSQGPENQPHTP